MPGGKHMLKRACHRITLLTTLAIIFFSGCIVRPASPTPPIDPLSLTRIQLGAGRGIRGSWFEIYFTDTQSPLASQMTGGPDGPLAAAIDEARLSVDIAIY